MNTKMIAATLGLSALLASGVAAAGTTAHDPYYAAFYGMSSIETPPRGDMIAPMQGKAAYGSPTNAATGVNADASWRKGDSAEGQLTGDAAYRKAFNPD